MLRILSSTATKPSRTFSEAKREKGEDNLQWLRRLLGAGAAGEGLRRPLEKTEKGRRRQREPTFLLLLGGRGHAAFRIRVAQSHLRHDFTPSHWSHGALLGPISRNLGQTPLYEISVEPSGGFGMPAASNALQDGRLDAYAEAKRYPNIALLRLPVDANEWQKPSTKDEVSVIERYQKQRSVLDATELLLQWLSYLWGVGRASNPLLEGFGLPSTAMIEVVLGASRYDITPGLESRASCPEAIWQAAKWWHPYFSSQKAEPIEGAFFVEHKLEV
jgi:hypothetical protein